MNPRPALCLSLLLLAGGCKKAIDSDYRDALVARNHAICGCVEQPVAAVAGCLDAAEKRYPEPQAPGERAPDEIYWASLKPRDRIGARAMTEQTRRCERDASARVAADHQAADARGRLAPLFGRWKLDSVVTSKGPVPKSKLAGGSMIWEFAPDNRFAATVTAGKRSAASAGSFTVDGDQLTVVENGAAPQRMTFMLTGETLTLVNSEGSVTLHYRKLSSSAAPAARGGSGASSAGDRCRKAMATFQINPANRRDCLAACDARMAGVPGYACRARCTSYCR